MAVTQPRADYQGLRIGRRTVAAHYEGYAKLVSDIKNAATAVVRDLKAVMSY